MSRTVRRAAGWSTCRPGGRRASSRPASSCASCGKPWRRSPPMVADTQQPRRRTMMRIHFWLRDLRTPFSALLGLIALLTGSHLRAAEPADLLVLGDIYTVDGA